MNFNDLKVSLNHCITNLWYGKWCYCIVTAIVLLQKHCVLFHGFSGTL